MILARYVDLRRHFTVGAETTGVSLTFTNADSTISRGSGSFVSNGYVAGMTLDVFGSADNTARFTIDSVSALSMTISGFDLVDETVTASLWGAFYEVDGMEQWPITKLHTAGFDAAPTMSTRPFSPLPITLSCNAGVTDAVAGTTYKWWLSQRTDIAASQYLAATHPDSASTGTVQLALTSLAVSTLGLATTTDPLNAGQRIQVFKHCRLFVQRASDRAVQAYDLLALSEGHTV